LGALDAMTRMRMQHELERLWQDSQPTMIMVTHDIEEAVYLTDKIVVMSGRGRALGEVMPVALSRPRDRSAARFVEIRETLLRRFNLASH
jgi:ABC-type nitrate/sulfonate/bicarbonate transport system ATPase subunit